MSIFFSNNKLPNTINTIWFSHLFFSLANISMTFFDRISLRLILMNPLWFRLYTIAIKHPQTFKQSKKLVSAAVAFVATTVGTYGKAEK